MLPDTPTRYDDWKGRHVRFHLGDVYSLDPAPIRALELTGTVVDVSHDSRGSGAVFAIVEVPTVSKPCIVPFDRILPAESGERP